MSLPPAAPFQGRSKWKHVLTFLAIAVGAAFFVMVVVVAVPRDVLAMQLLAAYTALAGGICLVLAATLLLTRRLPAGLETDLDGEPAVLFRAWPLQWGLEVATDAAAGTLGMALFVLDMTSGGEFFPWSIIALAAGAWFLVRAGLALAGRRRNEALWVTEREVVHDTDWGRERCARSDVERVRQMSDWQRLLLVVDGPITRQLCPRPWRRRTERLYEEGDMSFDCSLVGPDVEDLVGWLSGTLPAEGTAVTRRH